MAGEGMLAGRVRSGGRCSSATEPSITASPASSDGGRSRASLLTSAYGAIPGEPLESSQALRRGRNVVKSEMFDDGGDADCRRSSQWQMSRKATRLAHGFQLRWSDSWSDAALVLAGLGRDKVPTTR